MAANTRRTCYENPVHVFHHGGRDGFRSAIVQVGADPNQTVFDAGGEVFCSI
jgi:hypothetical protein